MAEIQRLANVQNAEVGKNVAFVARISQVKQRDGRFGGVDIFFDINDKDIHNSGRIFGADEGVRFDPTVRVVSVVAQRAKENRNGMVCWNISKIQNSHLPCKDFLRRSPTYTRDLQRLNSYLTKFRGGEYGSVGRVAEAVIQKHWKQYITWPASQNQHHNYLGGLLEHSLETLDKTLKYYSEHKDEYPECSLHLLEVGCLVHDIGKLTTMYLEEDTGDIYGTPFMELSNHSIEGVALLRPFMHIDVMAYLALQHIIAAHHGSIHHGAIIEPKLIEAYLINVGDGMSGKYNHHSYNINVAGLKGWS